MASLAKSMTGLSRAAGVAAGDSFVSQTSNISNALTYFVRKNYLKNISQPADEHLRILEPFNPSKNPLIVKAVLNFCLPVNKFDDDDEEISKVSAMDANKILECRSLKQLFVLAINHFRYWIFSASQLYNTG